MPESTTIFDKEIAELERQRQELEMERSELSAGHLVTRDVEGHLVEVDLGPRPGQNYPRPQPILRSENPLVAEIANSFKNEQEFREEMILKGLLPSQAAPASRFGLKNSLLISNYHLNRAVRQKSPFLAKLVSSGWLFAAGLLLLLVWVGGPLIFALSGGEIGGTRPPAKQPSSTPSPLFSPSFTADHTSGVPANSATQLVPTPTLPILKNQSNANANASKVFLSYFQISNSNQEKRGYSY